MRIRWRGLELPNRVTRDRATTADFATYGKQFDYAQARPNFSGYVGASQRLQVHLHKAFLGQESPQKAMDAAVQEIKASTGGGNNP